MFRLLGNAVLIFVVIVTTVLWFSPPGAESAPSADEISIDMGEVSEPNRAVVRKASRILLEHCSRLLEHWEDVESVTALAYPVQENIEWRGLPWKRVVELKFVIARDAESMPRWTRASGHHLRYYMGAAGNPGIDMNKQQAHAMCSDDPVPAAFIRDRRLTFIDSELQG